MSQTKHWGDAELSANGVFRYLLRRSRNSMGLGSVRKPVGWVMLNPSTADAQVNDPTISRLEDFSFNQWGFDEFQVTNIGAFRASSPKTWRAAADPFGPGNDEYIVKMAQTCEFVVCAWGKHGRPRQAYVLELLRGFDLRYLKLNKDNSPAHPLYLPSNLKPEKWILT